MCDILCNRKGVNGMASRSKKKPRKRKPAGQPKRMTAFLDSILAGVISGLMALALQKLFHW